MNTELFFSHESDEWETPQDLFDKLDDEFHFDLDPCATAENAKCDVYFTREQNGLSVSWGGAECSVIHRTHRFASGLRKHTAKERRIIPSLSY